MTLIDFSAVRRALAFKAYEIEEAYDVYVSRPLGGLIAYAARGAGVSPNQLTIVGALVGVVAGLSFYDAALGVFGFLLLLLHGLIDSADGQLARLTGRTSELGRVLDGAGGYVTHIALYAAIAAGAVARGASQTVWLVAIVAGISTVAHAQMYDYHRTTYIDVVLKGRARNPNAPQHVPAWARTVLRIYDASQRLLIGEHAAVESLLARRAAGGLVPDADRERYRQVFYARVRGWNALGDNGRCFAVGICAVLGRPTWYFWWEIIVANAVLAGLWVWQRRADRLFVSEFR
ncbi:MAG: CDP-alcohol phosphatidyltransferase family protein [Betaproteobacteria bacterium]